MLLAALLDAGADRDELERVPAALGLGEVELVVAHVERHGIGALHVDVRAPDEDPHRSWRTIRAMLEGSELPQRVREHSLAVFARLAEAEGRVHGVPPEEVHFHELGAVDTLVDVCGGVALLESLAVERVECSPLPAARGFVRAAHGLLPLPSPATLELLRLAGAPLRGVEEEGELVTPTGAALAVTLAESFGAPPDLTLERVGYGAGTRDTEARPNLVRVLVGQAAPAAAPPGVGEAVLLEANLDDLLPELVPDAAQACLTAGALDVWTVPAQMKKGRPGFVFAALVRPGDEAAVAEAMLRQTSTLGVRSTPVRRRELERRERVVEIEGAPVRVKLGLLGGEVVNVAPEHDDCAAVAARLGRPVKSIWAAALAAVQEP